VHVVFDDIEQGIRRQDLLPEGFILKNILTGG